MPTPRPSPFFAPAGGEESGQLSRNVALARNQFPRYGEGILQLDYEGGRATAIYFRDSLNNYQKARMRARYRLLPT